MPPTLAARERAHLKARAHALEAVVQVGHAGMTPEILAGQDHGGDNPIDGWINCNLTIQQGLQAPPPR